MSGVVKDIPIGSRFGKLVVLARAPFTGHGAMWATRCECGNEKIVRGTKLRSAEVTSCGCAVDRSAPSPVAPLGGAYIALGHGLFALIDVSDLPACREILWHCDPHGYAANWHAGVLHRFLLGAKKGEWVDHINGDRLDDRRSNLRLVTVTQSAWNRAAGRNKGSSKFKGAYYSKRDGTWFAKAAGVRLGTFKSAEEAARAYDAAARVMSRGFAAVNFPQAGERGTS